MRLKVVFLLIGAPLRSPLVSFAFLKWMFCFVALSGANRFDENIMKDFWTKVACMKMYSATTMP